MSDTGHNLELSNATDALADAITTADPVALRRAAGDHATALNSQATAMAASIAQPLYGRFDAMAVQLKELATIFTNARQADLTWRTVERDTRDAQNTRLYAELDRVLIAVQDGTARLGKLESRMGASESDRVQINARLEQSNARLDRIERLMAERPEQRRTEHQAIIDAVRGD